MRTIIALLAAAAATAYVAAPEALYSQHPATIWAMYRPAPGGRAVALPVNDSGIVYIPAHAHLFSRAR